MADGTNALNIFTRHVIVAIQREAVKQIAKAKAGDSQASVVVHDEAHVYPVRLTKKQLQKIGLRAATAAALRKNIARFKGRSPEEVGVTVKEWTTITCENEKKKLGDAQEARELARAKAKEAERAREDYSAPKIVTADDLVDSTEGVDEAENRGPFYVLECNASSVREPTRFERELGAVAFTAVRDVLAGTETMQSDEFHLEGTMTITLNVGNDGAVKVTGVSVRDFNHPTGRMSSIRAAIHNHFRGRKFGQLPRGALTYNVPFHETADQKPQIPPPAVLFTS